MNGSPKISLRNLILTKALYKFGSFEEIFQKAKVVINHIHFSIYCSLFIFFTSFFFAGAFYDTHNQIQVELRMLE